MIFINKLLISISAGWIIAAALIYIAFQIEGKIAAVMLWNVALIGSLAGNGPLLGYDTQGNPMYEGTPVHLLFGIIGLLSSFLIYPLLVFLILVVRDKLTGRKKLD